MIRCIERGCGRVATAQGAGIWHCPDHGLFGVATARPEPGMTPLETAQAELARAFRARLEYPLGSHARENTHAWVRVLVRRVYNLGWWKAHGVTNAPDIPWAPGRYRGLPKGSP